MSLNIPIQTVLEKIKLLRSETRLNYLYGLDELKSWLQEQQTLQAKNEFAHHQLRKKASQVNDIREMI